jgi:Domain of unknown function (DUF4386)
MSTRPAAVGAIEPAQRSAAKVAGFMYLFTLVTSNFAEFYARGRLHVGVLLSAKEVGSERIFRAGIVGDLITCAGVVILVVALYVVLRPVNRNVALLAAFLRLAESGIFAVITLNDFAALRVLSGADYLQAFSAAQLQALARLFLSLHDSGYLIGLVFCGLGSALFSYLFLRSRYIARWLAGLGVFSSLLVALVTLAIMVFPNLAAIVVPVYFAPSFVFEVTLGIWLLVKGIEPQAVA